MHRHHVYRILFCSTFQLSACTVGGGFVIVPLMRKKFVDELGWIGEEEMLDLTAIAQSSPGAIAVNVAVLLGYHIAGLPGALLGVLGTVLPPMGIISLISFFYTQFRDHALVNAAMTGMMAGVAAVVLDVVITMVQGVLRQKRVLPAAVMTAAFAAVHFFDVNIISVILLCGAIGAADALWRGRKGGHSDDIA